LGAGVRGVELLVEPDDGVGTLTRAIRGATSSIFLTMYMLTNRTIIHDLEYAHAGGVDVRVILEPHPYGSSDNANLSAYNNLMAADIPVHWSSSRFLLTHEKSMLVDGATAAALMKIFARRDGARRNLTAENAESAEKDKEESCRWLSLRSLR